MPTLELQELHTELLADESGERRNALLARLRAMQAACQSAKRQLSDREVYKQAHAAGVAVAAAIHIVERVRPNAAPGTSGTSPLLSSKR